MKKIITLVAVLVLCISSISFANGGRKIAEITLKGLMFKDKINVLVFQDPDMPFISIYLTHIKAGGFAMADPSNNSIATRLTGDLGEIVTKANPAVINLKKSIGWKTLKIARFYDEPNNTMVYVTYSTKVIEGSLKHSMSVVPLGRKL
jgi:CreA protein